MHELRLCKKALPPCMHRTLSSIVAANGSQLKRLLRRFQAQMPCCSPNRSVHSSRNPNSALMSEACRCMRCSREEKRKKRQHLWCPVDERCYTGLLMHAMLDYSVGEQISRHIASCLPDHCEHCKQCVQSCVATAGLQGSVDGPGRAQQL